MWESKVAPLAGVLFAVLLVVGFIFDPNTTFMPPESEALAHVTSDHVQMMTSAYLSILAAAALLWFSGSVYKSLRDQDDDRGRLSVIALGGGAVASGLLTVGAACLLAAAERFNVAGSIDPAVAASLVDVSGIALGNGVPVGLAALIGAFGVARLRANPPSLWAGWVSVVVALGLISPVAWALLAPAMLWPAVVGVWLYRNEPAPVAMEATA